VLAVHCSATEWEAAWTPVPESEIVAGESVALLATVTVAVKVPEALGENVKSRVAPWPGARVSPAETPLAEYDEPETPTLEMVIPEFPVLVNVTFSDFSLLMETSPKLKLEALGTSNAVAAIPVPLTETVLAELEALLRTDTAPDTLPVVFGENSMLKLDCLPGPMVRGSEIPVTASPFVVVLTWVTVRFDPPPFEMVTDWEAVLPTATDPKLTETGETEIVAGEGVPEDG
jgi:hypothetical protein